MFEIKESKNEYIKEHLWRNANVKKNGSSTSPTTQLSENNKLCNNKITNVHHLNFSP